MFQLLLDLNVVYNYLGPSPVALGKLTFKEQQPPLWHLLAEGRAGKDFSCTDVEQPEKKTHTSLQLYRQLCLAHYGQNRESFPGTPGIMEWMPISDVICWPSYGLGWKMWFDTFCILFFPPDFHWSLSWRLMGKGWCRIQFLPSWHTLMLWPPLCVE